MADRPAPPVPPDDDGGYDVAPEPERPTRIGVRPAVIATAPLHPTASPEQPPPPRAAAAAPPPRTEIPIVPYGERTTDERRDRFSYDRAMIARLGRTFGLSLIVVGVLLLLVLFFALGSASRARGGAPQASELALAVPVVLFLLPGGLLCGASKAVWTGGRGSLVVVLVTGVLLAAGLSLALLATAADAVLGGGGAEAALRVAVVVVLLVATVKLLFHAVRALWRPGGGGSADRVTHVAQQLGGGGGDELAAPLRLIGGGRVLTGGVVAAVAGTCLVGSLQRVPAAPTAAAPATPAVTPPPPAAVPAPDLYDPARGLPARDRAFLMRLWDPRGEASAEQRAQLDALLRECGRVIVNYADPRPASGARRADEPVDRVPPDRLRPNPQLAARFAQDTSRPPVQRGIGVGDAHALLWREGRLFLMVAHGELTEVAGDVAIDWESGVRRKARWSAAAIDRSVTTAVRRSGLTVSGPQWDGIAAIVRGTWEKSTDPQRLHEAVPALPDVRVEPADGGAVRVTVAGSEPRWVTARGGASNVSPQDRRALAGDAGRRVRVNPLAAATATTAGLAAAVVGAMTVAAAGRASSDGAAAAAARRRVAAHLAVTLVGCPACAWFLASLTRGEPWLLRHAWSTPVILGGLLAILWVPWAGLIAPLQLGNQLNEAGSPRLIGRGRGS